MKNLPMFILLLLLPVFASSQEFETIELNEVVFQMPCPSEHNIYNWNNPNGVNQSFRYINHDLYLYILVSIEELSFYNHSFEYDGNVNSESQLKEFYSVNLKKWTELSRVTYRKFNWSYPKIDNLLAIRNEGKMMYYMDNNVVYHDNIRFILNGKIYWFHFQCNAEDIAKWGEFRKAFFDSINIKEGFSIEDQYLKE